MNESQKMLKHAIINNELHAYLMGQKQYGYQDKWIETPTDIAKVFICDFNGYVNEDKGNKERLEAAIHTSFLIMLKEPVGTWWTLSIIYSYLFGYISNSLLFNIDIHPLIPHINKSLESFKDNLKSNRQWVGWRFPNGLWDDVVFVSRAINETLGDNSIKIQINKDNNHEQI
jgi:hypothetical protein